METLEPKYSRRVFLSEPNCGDHFDFEFSLLKIGNEPLIKHTAFHFPAKKGIFNRIESVWDRIIKSKCLKECSTLWAIARSIIFEKIDLEPLFSIEERLFFLYSRKLAPIIMLYLAEYGYCLWNFFRVFFSESRRWQSTESYPTMRQMFYLYLHKYE